MNRREFLGAGVAGAAAVTTKGAAAMPEPKFRLKYGPHFGMFQNHAGPDPVDQLKFAADQGFTAWEDNGMRGRPKDEQERIGKAMAQLGITMGVFVVNPETAFGSSGLASGDKATLDKFLAGVRDSLEVMKRVNAKWATVVPGEVATRVYPDYQTANVIDALRRASELCEPAGLVMVLEPLNWFRDHPNLFLRHVPQAYMICRAVNSPSCKILYDLYHAQIEIGNIIPNIDMAWSEIAYYQIGDNPGRKEPTTGEMNYKAIFKHIHARGFAGVLGMEHGNARPGKDGETALIKAYRECDSF